MSTAAAELLLHYLAQCERPPTAFELAQVAGLSFNAAHTALRDLRKAGQVELVRRSKADSNYRWRIREEGPTVTVHALKSWPEYFEPLWHGTKRFELRKDDRKYHAGDHLLIREYEPQTDSYTGREVKRRITYVLHGLGSVGTIQPLKGLSSGYVILSLEEIA